MTTTHDERERFRRMVDSLEAALLFDDFTACLERMQAEHGEEAAGVAVALLAARLLEGRAA